MEFTVDTDNVILLQNNQIESGEYNATECQFTFSIEYEDLTKKAVFTGEDGTAYVQTIVDDVCSIPSEVLSTSQVVQIGVYGYSVDGTELTLRYSPKPTQFYIDEGSYKEAQNSTPPTPSEIEQLQGQITQNANDIEVLQENYGTYDTAIANLQSDVGDIKAEQITQNDNISTLQSTKADKSEIPTKTSDLTNDSGFIDNTVNDLTNYTKTSDLSQVATSGSYNDLSNKPDLSVYATTEALGQEVTDRENADIGLQSQIDAITVSSDVIDVLGTYQDLQNYDTSHVKANDIIKVLQDSTHSNAMSYYRWVIVDHVGSWVYVGSEGPYYTKSETDTLLNDKVDKVSGKGLSTNDFTNEYKEQITTNQNAIAGIKNGTTINSFGAVETALNDKENSSNKVTSLSSSSTDTQYPSAKCVYDIVGDIESILETLDIGGGVQ